MTGAKFRVLAVADGMIPSVELVLERPLSFLAAQGELEFGLYAIEDAEPIARELDRCDLLIVMRACQPNALSLVEAAKAAGTPVIYAIDDDFESLDPASPLGRHYRESGAWPRLLSICGLADQVWAFSDVLKRKILPAQPNIVVPPAIASLESISQIRSGTNEKDRSTERVTVGYAASLLHSSDIEDISPVLTELLAQFPHLHLELIGVRSESLAGHSRVTHFPSLPGIRKYYEFVLARQWDVGIAPLLRSPANDAKTDNKYREYAALGIPAVYADAPPYWRSVIDGFNGLVANSHAGWREGLVRLIEDRTLAARIVANAEADVQQRYSLQNVSKKYLDLMRSAIEPRRKVLVIAAPIATTVIDIALPFERLQSEGRLEWRTKDGAEVTPEDLAWADMLVISRMSDPPTVLAARQAKEDYGLPVVFSWDDDFFVIPDSIGAVARYHKDPVILRGLEELLSTADLVKASTPRIAERSRAYGSRVVQHHYGFDFSQLDDVPHAASREGDTVTIGFFGSADHSKALETLLDALAEVARIAPQTRFEFFGPRTAKLEALPRTTFIPFSPSSRESLRTLATRQWDIGLAPLEVSDFNRAKLPTKYRDYGACHVAGVYTRIDPYMAVVSDGSTGFLVDNEKDAWIDAIMRLVHDKELRREIAANAHAHVRNELSLEKAVEAWRGIVADLLPTTQGNDVLSDKHRRKLQTLERRVEHLANQVEALKESGRRLLMLEGRSPHRTPRSRAIVHRALNRLIAMYLRRSPIQASIGPISPRAAAFASEICEGSATSVHEISANLQTVTFIEYPVEEEQTQAAMSVRAAFAATVPTLSGSLGMELITREDEIHDHVVLPIEQLDPDLLVEFPMKAPVQVGPGWRVRFFVRDSQSPIFVREYMSASGAREALYAFLPDNDGG
ncbi:glycosyltransferase [Pseudoxanthomonas sp. LH2527]|uniref:glycosyltransferase n=1 Tax=Pseudoxanthomonas sp. LH2527 TaxID=2923249 RepID=UPI001F13F562|nr:glycosyltransferase [Pseudoxanthomonas sp. LH2527]MCH6482373.1 glycosyltransferase [Pseudoxanthomonas sp. LH2527]